MPFVFDVKTGDFLNFRVFKAVLLLSINDGTFMRTHPTFLRLSMSLMSSLS